MLRRNLRLILSFAIAALLLTAAILTVLPASYTATAILLYDPATPPGAPPIPTQDEQAELASQSAIITSLPALQEIAASPALTANPGFATALWPFHPPNTAEARLTAARRALQVYIPPNARLLQISFTAASPAGAADAANLAANLYLTHQRDQAFADLQTQQSWLQSHQSALQSDLDTTEASLAAARLQAGQVAGMQGDLSAETASRITASLVDAQAALAMATARLHAATTSDAAADAAVAPNLQPLRKEQADFAAQVNALAQSYGPNYPDLATARTSLAAINGEIAAETAREIAAARAEFAADQAAVTTLTASLAAARQHSQAQDAQSAPQQVLAGHAESDRAMLSALAIQSGQLAQQAAIARLPASIISPATPPLSPDRAHRSLIIAAAGLFGLCLGILIAGLGEALDTSFRNGAALTAATGLTCLALLPEVANPREAALDQPFSLFAEQMRALRTAMARNRQASILAITAARPDEGKTTLTAALGRALAAAGANVLVVDADIRQPSFDIAFCTRHSLGLTDHLAGLATLDDVLQQDFRGKLRVLTAGTQTADALSLFLSPRFPALLTQLRQRFEIILIDAPPAFALAETQILAGQADGILFCVRWGKTPHAVVTAALNILAQAHTNNAHVAFSGAILTRVDPARHRRSGFADAELYQPRFAGYFRS
jgi:capsular exopolysaccharide synthesis family protein